jgi:hypothetical protein
MASKMLDVLQQMAPQIMTPLSAAPQEPCVPPAAQASNGASQIAQVTVEVSPPLTLLLRASHLNKKKAVRREGLGRFSGLPPTGELR